MQSVAHVRMPQMRCSKLRCTKRTGTSDWPPIQLTDQWSDTQGPILNSVASLLHLIVVNSKQTR
jgi:hypothetical protein